MLEETKDLETRLFTEPGCFAGFKICVSLPSQIMQQACEMLTSADGKSNIKFEAAEKYTAGSRVASTAAENRFESANGDSDFCSKFIF